jgi:hypothetical protein
MEMPEPSYLQVQRTENQVTEPVREVVVRHFCKGCESPVEIPYCGCHECSRTKYNSEELGSIAKIVTFGVLGLIAILLCLMGGCYLSHQGDERERDFKLKYNEQLLRSGDVKTYQPKDRFGNPWGSPVIVPKSEKLPEEKP